MNKHLIVVSIDAMVYDDIEYASTLPNFKKIIESGAVIERVRTIYPTLTHPIHATIISGATAGRTGIVNNVIFDYDDPKRDSVWYNALGQINCDTLLHAAKRAGLTTAVSTWPVTTLAGDTVDYLVPGVLNPDFAGFEDNPSGAHRKLGASDEMIEIIEEGIRRYGWRDVHPAIDYYQTYCAAEIIKRYKPNLLLTHPGYVDSARHLTGVFSDKVTESIRETDIWLGMLLDAVREAGIEDETDIVLLSDHGQIGVTRYISPNVYLAEAGYITLSDSGEITDYSAYVKSAGASAHVYLKNKTDREVYEGVYKLLSDMARSGLYGFERVYTADEVKEKYDFYGDFSFVLETDGYTAFTEQTTAPAVTTYDYGSYRNARGKHGHEPDKGPQPTFIASGPSFKRGAVLKEGNILNHAPTLAKALGVTLYDAMGIAEEEILNV